MRAAGGGRIRRLSVVEVVAFVFSIFTLYGCGPTPVLYGLVLLLLGIPVYVWQQRRASETLASAANQTESGTASR